MKPFDIITYNFLISFIKNYESGKRKFYENRISKIKSKSQRNNTGFSKNSEAKISNYKIKESLSEKKEKFYVESLETKKNISFLKNEIKVLKNHQTKSNESIIILYKRIDELNSEINNLKNKSFAKPNSKEYDKAAKQFVQHILDKNETPNPRDLHGKILKKSAWNNYFNDEIFWQFVLRIIKKKKGYKYKLNNDAIIAAELFIETRIKEIILSKNKKSQNYSDHNVVEEEFDLDFENYS